MRTYGSFWFQPLQLRRALSVVIWYFGSVSLISPLTNVLALPLIPFAMALSLGTWVLSLISFPYAGWLSYPVLTTIVHIADWGSRLPFASVEFKSLWYRVLVLCVLCLVYALVVFRRMWLLKLIQRFRKSGCVASSRGDEVEVVTIDSKDILNLK